MEIRQEWESEEEGLLICSGAERFCLTVKCFITGEKEAELQIQDIVSECQKKKREKMSEKVIFEMTECLEACFRHMWEAGFEETVLVEKNGSELSQILNSTTVVQRCYSEYMMRRLFEPQTSINCVLDGGAAELQICAEEEGFSCENKEKSFFCRLLPYSARAGEQSFYLYEVEVEKKKRNRGIATNCLNGLFRHLAEQQPLTVYLQVGSYNEPAVHLYRKLGFEISEEFCYYVLRE